LIYAVLNLRIDIIRLLLSRGANVNNINYFGWTALDYALQKGNYHIIQILFWRGAKSNSYKIPKKLINIDSLILLMYSRIIPIDLLREIHTKWIVES